VRWLLILALAGCGRFGEPCDPACNQLVAVDTTLALTPDRLSGAEVEVCMNGACSLGTLPTIGSGDSAMLPLADPWLVNLAPSYDGGVAVYVYCDHCMLPLHDGDQLQLAIKSAAGARLFDGAGSATYMVYKCCQSGSATEGYVDL
jgi:hypothetical protein